MVDWVGVMEFFDCLVLFFFEYDYVKVGLG